MELCAKCQRHYAARWLRVVINAEVPGNIVYMLQGPFCINCLAAVASLVATDTDFAHRLFHAVSDHLAAHHGVKALPGLMALIDERLDFQADPDLCPCYKELLEQEKRKEKPQPEQESSVNFTPDLARMRDKANWN